MVNSKTTPPRRTGRRAGAPDTRSAILDSARALFSKKGLVGTTVRGVAKAAGVDPALVLHFFGSKDRLFEAAIDVPIREEEISTLLNGPKAGRGERAVRFYVEHLFRKRGRVMATLLRSAVSDPRAAALLRIAVAKGPVALVQNASGPDAVVGAEMFATMMLGLFFAKEIIGIEPLASLTDDELVARYAPLAQRLLSQGADRRPKAARSPR